ncbi:hypothetical protein CDD82_3408 [Ophiocordyceps australis]|uniref:Zn(2)-C6 fungal-type domain-containing protein n=1 Tax=Ophiocordyceps australis TaxID=1399860 RepID=A0A2C5ZCC2_9HYPO|nr:hypothetical protein CDD82_3408 [Ophiocordyceps australis]
MPAPRLPCHQCRARHVKCDDASPRCHQCEAKNLPCSRPKKKTRFKNGSLASFAPHHQQSLPALSTPYHASQIKWVNNSPPQDQPNLPSPSSIDCSHSPPAVSGLSWPHQSSHSPAFDETLEKAALATSRSFPLQDVQEACLFRYFVEQISHWFDLCDEYRHFQLVVPLRAKQYPHLLDAMFAVAARHLSRMPQYKTHNGIQYRGYSLPSLGDHVAVEYMLKCIPPLRQFHHPQDSSDYLDSIIATARKRSTSSPS